MSGRVTREAIDEALRGMLGLPEQEVSARLRQALSPSYWSGLVPDLPVGSPGAAAAVELMPIDDERCDGLVNQVRTEGFIRIESLLDTAILGSMRRAAETLEQHGWPQVFSFAFDHFWRVPRTASIRTLIAATLGPACAQVPSVWLHRVRGELSGLGWPPHQDNPEGGTRVTVWIPLTDATVDTGCISVLPLPSMPESVRGRWYEIQQFDRADVLTLLHQGRPLPVQVGGLLAWDASVVHWGTPRLARGAPRLSFSMEFIDASRAPAGLEPLLLAMDDAPSFERRLRIVAEMILQFGQNDARALRYAPLAAALLRELGCADGR